MTFNTDYYFAASLDAHDDLAQYRGKFHIPVQENGTSYVYFCGNSLGCQPRNVRRFIERELQDWERLGVEGHFHARKPWMPYHEFLTDSTAKLVGALSKEVVVMNSLTTNLHLLMASFYRPTATKYKILIEADAFPSDAYAVETQLALHGFPPEGLLKLYARQGETLLRTEDIEWVLEEQGDEIALMLIGGVNYYTGQLFDIQRITQKAHEKGVVAGWDLAHAAGNVPLQLHDWDVDFAAWCSYKYLNAGPGGVSGCFIHERHVENPDVLRLGGWWGHDKESRFQMRHGFQPIRTAEGWQLSNAPVLSMAALRASMAIFDEVGMEALRRKSEKMMDYLDYLLAQLPEQLGITVITPTEKTARGCQISLRCAQNGKQIHQQLIEKGVICDWREPDVIRIAPVPLYNRYMDIWDFWNVLKMIEL